MAQRDREMDARRGFEPRLTESESVVLPLDDRATEGREIGAGSHTVNAVTLRPRSLEIGARTASRHRRGPLSDRQTRSIPRHQPGHSRWRALHSI
jgi:hypothetical protein